MKISKNYFGSLSDGRTASVYTVSNGRMSFSASDYGCAVTGITVKDRNGCDVDVVVCPPTFTGFATEWGSYGSIVGRFANRISGARFSLDGKEYLLNDNSGGSCLHGGFPRWENEIWKAKTTRNSKGAGLRFSKVFPDGHQKFPGRLEVSVEYFLDDTDTLTFTYRALTDRATPISITNHSYFNLSGHGSVLDHSLKINSTKILEVDSNSVPTGKFIDVAGTPFDFTEEKKIGRDISEKILQKSMGYDHCYVTPAFREESGVPDKDVPLLKTAILSDEKTGIRLELSTNCEGLQLYTANYVQNLPGKNGAFHQGHCAVCLETQAFPDSPNRIEFPQAVLRPGRTYAAVTSHKFSVF